MQQSIISPGYPDKRGSHRFSLRLTVKCRDKENLLVGRTIAAESLNISSTGMIFRSPESFNPGQTIEAYIEWPALLNHHVPLTLVVEGEVVRTSGDQTAMRFERYEFKTRRR